MLNSMASLSHHLPSLFLFINLLYTSADGDSVKSSYNACPSFNCGNGLVIRYPFWQQNQQNSYCGYPGFGLSCHAQQPLLRLTDHLYHLTKIDYSKNTLTATYGDLNGNCPITAPHDVKLNSSSFLDYTIEDKLVHFFYNCTLYPPSLPSIACLRYGLKRSYVFVEGAIPEFDWEKYCEATVRVPVIEKAGDVGDGYLVNDFGRKLKEGFKLKWRSPDSTCQSCETSGGFCGYGNGLHQKFICYCNDGPQSVDCRDNGDLTSAFEPNFVATGALICGGLIIAATVFYFIQKKKIALKKPTFSRIPSSGK